MAAGVEGRRRGAQQQSAARLRQAGRVLGPLVERERTDDLAKSIMDGRFHEQKVHLVASGVRPLVYLVEEAGGRGSHCMADSALEQGVLNTQVGVAQSHVRVWADVKSRQQQLQRQNGDGKL
ncbi:structure-specific endonuclease subunit MUS81-like isoform X1 [Haemaphysalis longicornis]